MVPDGVEGLILEAGGEGSVLGGAPTFRAPGRLGSSWQWGRWSHLEAGPGWGLGQVFCLEAARKLGLSPAPGAAPLRRGEAAAAGPLTVSSWKSRGRLCRALFSVGLAPVRARELVSVPGRT